MPEVLCISDNSQNNLVIADLDAMSLRSTTAVGREPYPVDRIDQHHVIVSTRGERSVDVVRISDGCRLTTISLSHKPRSATSHPSRRVALVSGADIAVTSVVDTANHRVTAVVGSGHSSSVFDFGGNLACGHPFWVNEEDFLHLDRVDRRLELYCSQTGDVLDAINLATSPHHVEKAAGEFFVMCEGNTRSAIAPSVVKLRVAKNRITVVGQTFLPVPPDDIARTGGHHLTIAESQNRVFVGTNEGRLYVLRLTDLGFLNLGDTDAGCGHVTLCPEMGVAVTTNHTGKTMTVIDVASGRVVRQIIVSGPAVGSKKTQGHTSKWFPRTARLVTTASEEGRIIEVDPAAGIITREISVPGGYLIQGCFASL
jgi:hypothetical protein